VQFYGDPPTLPSATGPPELQGQRRKLPIAQGMPPYEIGRLGWFRQGIRIDEDGLVSMSWGLVSKSFRLTDFVRATFLSAADSGDPMIILTRLDGSEKRLILPELYPQPKEDLRDAVARFIAVDPASEDQRIREKRRAWRTNVGTDAFCICAALALGIWLSLDLNLPAATAALTGALGLSVGVLVGGRFRAGLLPLVIGFFVPFIAIAALRSYRAAVPYGSWWTAGLFLAKWLPRPAPIKGSKHSKSVS
jgi:hypothetical protein